MRAIYNVSIPVLCINSMDDPVCVRQNVPFDFFKTHPKIMLATTEHGGHCGFLEYNSLENWAGKVSIDYLTAILEYPEEEEGHVSTVSK